MIYILEFFLGIVDVVIGIILLSFFADGGEVVLFLLMMVGLTGLLIYFLFRPTSPSPHLSSEDKERGPVKRLSISLVSSLKKDFSYNDLYNLRMRQGGNTSPERLNDLLQEWLDNGWIMQVDETHYRRLLKANTDTWTLEPM